VPITNIDFFTNENATRVNVGDAISVVARKAKSGDRVYFYFAGHGDMEDLTQIENGLLLLYNSPNGNYFGMNDDVLEIIDLKRYLSPLAQKGIQMIFIVDACHSGNLKGGVQGLELTANALATSWGREYKILSCQPNQLSLEGKEWGEGRGLFSLHLEEGLKGMADKNNDGKISFSEIQRYITDSVAAQSEDTQIPVVTGDLGKIMATVDSATLTAIKKKKAEDYKKLNAANTKGSESKYVDSLDAAGKALYNSYKENLKQGRLILPVDTNALKDYRSFVKKYPDNTMQALMRRNLAAALNTKFDSIVAPLLKGESSVTSKEDCSIVAAELDSCLSLLGKQHYMFTAIKARKLYMQALSKTLGLTENEYNYKMRPVVLESVMLLEQSAGLEPNAAYTYAELGSLYIFLYDYKRSNKAFEKYVSLRPNDFQAKYTLARTYARLKQFDKGEALFLELLQRFPENLSIRYGLVELYQEMDKRVESLRLIDEIVAEKENMAHGYFAKGVFYAKENNTDSAIFYYNKTKEIDSSYKPVCDNNIGFIFFINEMPEFAKLYFGYALEGDSANTHAYFNLGTIYHREGNYDAAMKEFSNTLTYATLEQEGFLTNLHLYFGKELHQQSGADFEEFKKKVFSFNMQYLAYTSIMYSYCRVQGLIPTEENINFLFEEMFVFKQYDVYTWYHYASIMSFLKKKKEALEALEKTLSLGFGLQYLLLHDKDLDYIRNTPEFKAMMKKYFPGGKK
jgi:tetratricopeptide (TPR) repeat protein